MPHDGRDRLRCDSCTRFRLHNAGCPGRRALHLRVPAAAAHSILPLLRLPVSLVWLRRAFSGGDRGDSLRPASDEGGPPGVTIRRATSAAPPSVRGWIEPCARDKLSRRERSPVQATLRATVRAKTSDCARAVCGVLLALERFFSCLRHEASSSPVVICSRQLRAQLSRPAVRRGRGLMS